MSRRGILILAVILVGSLSVSADAIRAGFDGSTLTANDDGSTGLVAFGFTANFFGPSYTGAYVNNNGNITFTGPMSTFTPFPILTTGTPLIAPFFADVDTRAAGSSLVTYGTGTVGTRAAFGVNWLDVGYFGVHDDLLNSFQLVMIDRSDIAAGDFDFEFNYRSIQWETGDASSGSGGLGGSSARVGYSNGISTALELCGSAVNGAFLDGSAYTCSDLSAGGGLSNNSNIREAGRYLFSVRSGIVTPGDDTAPVPEPATLILMGSGLLGLASRLRRKA